MPTSHVDEYFAKADLFFQKPFDELSCSLMLTKLLIVLTFEKAWQSWSRHAYSTITKTSSEQHPKEIYTFTHRRWNETNASVVCNSIPFPQWNVCGILSAGAATLGWTYHWGSCLRKAGVSESIPDTLHMIKRSDLRSLCFSSGLVGNVSRFFLAHTRTGLCFSILARFGYHGWLGQYGVTSNLLTLFLWWFCGVR